MATLILTLGAGCGGDDDSGKSPDAGISLDRGLIKVPDSFISPGQDSGTQKWDTSGPLDSTPAADSPVYITKKVCIGECTSVSDCEQGAKACTNGVCIYCTSDADCAQYGGAQKCDVTAGMCIMCEQDSHCMYYGQKMMTGMCDPTYKMCVKCNSDADCDFYQSPAKLCVNNVCVACKSDADCANEHVKGCDTKSGFCYRCKSDPECCPPETPQCGLTCDLPTGVCLCQTDQQCSDLYTKGKWECKQPPTP
jgi:hypothetical protein